MDETREKNAIYKIVGSIMVLASVSGFITGTALLAGVPSLHYYTPPYMETSVRDMKIGTYVYAHNQMASYPEYFDDLALMTDRVLVDISWGDVMKNDSYPDCFNLQRYSFYDIFCQNLSSRGLGVVIQFSPTRSPPAWLNVALEMDDYRAEMPPQDAAERARFIEMLLHYVNFTVSYFNNKSYFVELEYCLADEPHTADWADVLQGMYDTIKAVTNTTVSLVLHKPELYDDFFDAFDMITIDPYNDDVEMVQKIRKAHADVNYSKYVRVIISGMDGDQFDYQRVYRQLVISWFMGAYDIWYWSYNCRWDGKSNEWYVVLFSEDGPIHTERADAIISAKQDLALFAEIDTYLKIGLNQTVKFTLTAYQEQAYTLIMRNNFGTARSLLLKAHGLILNS